MSRSTLCPGGGCRWRRRHERRRRWIIIHLQVAVSMHIRVHGRRTLISSLYCLTPIGDSDGDGVRRLGKLGDVLLSDDFGREHCGHDATSACSDRPKEIRLSRQPTRLVNEDEAGLNRVSPCVIATKRRKAREKQRTDHALAGWHCWLDPNRRPPLLPSYSTLTNAFRASYTAPA